MNCQPTCSLQEDFPARRSSTGRHGVPGNPSLTRRRDPVRRPATIDPMVSMAESLVRLSELAASPVVSKVASAFADAGFELSLVGGPVRDAMLGRVVSDLDFTTN